MKNPDPNVMRKIFNDPKALEQLTNVLSKKDPTKDNTIMVDNTRYVVRTSSTINKLKDL